MSTIGRYQIERELGRGGMATVYLAFDPRFDREVAVKVLPREFLHDPQFRARFEREAKLIAALEDPAIVPVYDFGEEAGQPYLVMRYMAGGSLSDRLQQGPLTLAEASSLLARLAPALDKAHRSGVVHRDLKPANILFDRDGNPTIADFGIAKLLEGSASFTATGIIGTPAYMSPEQVEGELALDGRSDVYALGVILYQMLTGKPPYDAETPISVALMHVRKPVPHVVEAAPSLPQAVDQVVTTALAKDRGQRYPTSGALAAALAQAAANAVPPTRVVPPSRREQPETSPPAARPKPQPARQPRLTALLLGVVGLLAVVVALIMATLDNGGTGRATPTAQGLSVLPRTDSPASSPTAPLPATEAPVLPTDTPIAIDDMIVVPAGDFTMGSPEGVGSDDERPQHTMYLDAFYIDKTEVTAAQYQRCVDAGPCTAPNTGGECTYGVSSKSNHPINCVDWNQAVAFCRWVGKRLPTEAEWEKAARGDRREDGRIYPWGNEEPDCGRLNYSGKDGDCVGSTASVGRYPRGASPYGALDMAGNVREWVADWYDSSYYTQSPRQNPQGPASGEYRVVRGGSWFNFTYFVRAADRDGDSPGIRFNSVGVRCARS